MIIALIIVGSLILLYVIFGFVLRYIFCSNANIKRLKKKDSEVPYNQSDNFWFFSSENNIIETTSYDHKKIQTYFRRSKLGSHTYLIFCHGWTGDPEEKSKVLHKIYDKFDFNILSLVQRGQGLSNIKYITMGAKEGRDVLSWINYIIKKDNMAIIFLYGESMGAATVLYSLSYGVPENVVGVIEDCGYLSINKQFIDTGKSVVPSILSYIFAPSISLALLLTGSQIIKNNPKKGLIKSDIPILCIHGEKDELVPFDNLNAIKELNKSNIKTYSFPDAKHICSYEVDKNTYLSLLFSFMCECARSLFNCEKNDLTL